MIVAHTTSEIAHHSNLDGCAGCLNPQKNTVITLLTLYTPEPYHSNKKIMRRRPGPISQGQASQEQVGAYKNRLGFREAGSPMHLQEAWAPESS